jgi:hypothetical protein
MIKTGDFIPCAEEPLRVEITDDGDTGRRVGELQATTKNAAVTAAITGRMRIVVSLLFFVKCRLQQGKCRGFAGA